MWLQGRRSPDANLVFQTVFTTSESGSNDFSNFIRQIQALQLLLYKRVLFLQFIHATGFELAGRQQQPPASTSELKKFHSSLKHPISSSFHSIIHFVSANRPLLFSCVQMMVIKFEYTWPDSRILKPNNRGGLWISLDLVHSGQNVYFLATHKKSTYFLSAKI